MSSLLVLLVLLVLVLLLLFCCCCLLFWFTPNDISNQSPHHTTPHDTTPIDYLILSYLMLCYGNGMINRMKKSYLSVPWSMKHLFARLSGLTSSPSMTPAHALKPMSLIFKKYPRSYSAFTTFIKSTTSRVSRTWPSFSWIIIEFKKFRTWTT